MSFLAGLVFRQNPPIADDARLAARRLLEAASGRGSDDTGVWADSGVVIGVRALRTLDLTPDGSQPTRSADGRMMVALDGGIANNASLRRELEDAGIRFHGHGDSELIAAGAAHWGLNRLLQRMEGAFAFILWDAESKALHLVRDRMGVKPLYVTATSNVFAFASDYRAFKTLNQFTPAINPEAMQCFLSRGHIIPPLAPWKDVISLPPAGRIMLREADQTVPTAEIYWSAGTVLEESALRSRPRDEDAARLDRLSAALAAEAIHLDVPFAQLDDYSTSSGMLRARLDYVCARPFKLFGINNPDGPALQISFEALAKLPEPISDPSAPAWYAALKRIGTDASVILMPTALERPSDDSDHDIRIRRIIDKIPRFLRKLVPAKYAHLAQDAQKVYTERNAQWDNAYEAPNVTEARFEQSLAQKLAFHTFLDSFTRGYLPALDRIAGSINLDLRAPMADARMLDFGLPCTASKVTADIVTWLRGPLRPRMQDLLSPALFKRLGIDDPAPYMADWQGFLAGDNKPARRLWTLATLLAWTKAHP